MTGSLYALLSMFRKIKPPVFLETKLEDDYEFIMDFHERFHTMRIVD